MIDRPPDGMPTIRLGAASALVSTTEVAELAELRPNVDVRGWEVVLADGSALGVVDRYLLDVEAKRLRYLAVTPVEGDGHVLIPVGIGSLDPARRRLRLKKQRSDRLRALPLVTSDRVTSDIERAIYSAVTGKRVSTVALRHLHSDPIFDSSRLFGRARRDANR